MNVTLRSVKIFVYFVYLNIHEEKVKIIVAIFHTMFRFRQKAVFYAHLPYYKDQHHRLLLQLRIFTLGRSSLPVFS
jgi:hypothetical protein